MNPGSDQLIYLLAICAGFLPLAGALLLIIARAVSGRIYTPVMTFFLFLTFLLSAWLAWTAGISSDLIVQKDWTWFMAGQKNFSAGVLITGPAVMMSVIVSLIAALVSLYSHRYMENEEGLLRYFTMLGFFTFSMMGIIFAGNLILIFAFWELVGFASYMLINHFIELPVANKASKKAIIINRIGDAGFLIGIAILWMFFGTANLVDLQAAMDSSILSNGEWVWKDQAIPAGLLTIAGLGLFAGAVGKSAQFPLQVWLPDAMAGPTPVSALIHAATMVAAGVFLLSRVFMLLGWDVLQVIAVIGAITAFMGAVAAMAQNDIKRVLAFSTISQLGYMVMGMGAGAYDAALFHLMTHAFFKAGLFLAAGSVIYSLHRYAHIKHAWFDAQDMRLMGGLRKYMPVTFVAYVMLSLALVGLPLFSGFLSKDAILSATFAWAADGAGWQFLVPVLGLISVALTAFYMMRQVLMVFFGEYRQSESTEGISESPGSMKYILVFLAFMSLAFVWSVNPVDPATSWIFVALKPPALLAPDIVPGLQEMLSERIHEVHLWISLLSISMIALGSFLAFRKYRHYKAASSDEYRPSGLTALSVNNWYLDNIYQRIIVGPVLQCAKYVNRTDKLIIDGFINYAATFYVILSHIVAWIDHAIVDGLVNFTAAFMRFSGRTLNGLVRGNVQYFILVALIGVILLIWFVI